MKDLRNINCDIANKIIEESTKEDLTIPVCVPSYKFRKNAWLVHNFDKLNTDVYLFLYDDDFIKSGYSEFQFPKNVKIIRITEEDFKNLNLRWRGIQPKRRYIQIYMENLGIKRYFMVDDDLEEFGKYTASVRNNNCKSCKLGNISVENILKVMQYYSNHYPDYKMFGMGSPFSIGFSKFKGIIDNKIIACVYLLNNQNIPFSDKNIHEDNKLTIDSILANEKIGIIDFIAPVSLKMSYDTSTCENFDITLKDFLEYPNFAELKLKDDELSTRINIRLVRKNNQTFDKKLVDIVKTRNIEKIKEYLLSKNESSKLSEW